MTIDLSKCDLSVIWEDNNFVLYQGTVVSESYSIFVMSAASTQRIPAAVTQLEHAYALRSDLPAEWSVRPIGLVHYQDKPALLMENPGGELLASTLGEPWELTPFLRVAVGISTALSKLHAKGFVHKDLKPANILVDNRTRKTWLMGFGLMSRLLLQRQAPGPPAATAGTLPYMAPEQTGFVNGKIDFRSDQYSLGVTLYEMLTGNLPFAATDPIGWIHSHIAKRPIPANERVKDIPAPISLIISKLLSKNADDRYETMAGVEADLRRCLDEWESKRKINLFTLGTRDISDRFLIPEKLYGRENEIQIMLKAFNSATGSGRSGLLLVSGHAGIGKSSVVHALRREVISSQAVFLSGKVDSSKKAIPYATLAQAFRELTLKILSQNDVELAEWRDSLQEAVGASGQLIITLIPEVELIIGQQPPIPLLPPQDSKIRFRSVFRDFLSAFVRRQHALMLFLDDLQWMDRETLDLIGYLLIERDVRGLFIVGAYRTDEVSSSHPLMRLLSTVRQEEVNVHEVSLSPILPDHVAQLIADALHCEKEHAHFLAVLVHQRTQGNPFFVIQFITSLVDEQLIAFDYAKRAWSWDLNRVRAKSYTDNVVVLMLNRLNRLKGATRDILKYIACLGNSMEIRTLSRLLEVPDSEIEGTTRAAIHAGLISYSGGTYSFLHDRIQEAAYAMVDEKDRASIHLRIGRLLTKDISQEKSGDLIFDAVNQLNRSASLITSEGEREQTAELNLVAGYRAKAAAAYASALVHFAAGSEFLRESSWAKNYKLTFAIELNRCECQFLIGELDEAETGLLKLLTRVESLVDRSLVTCALVALYTTMDRSDRAVEVGLEYLQHVDIRWTPHPTDEEVSWEYARMQELLGNRHIEELHDLPLMSNDNWRATIDVLAEVTPPAVFTDENLHHLLLLRMTNVSLEHGTCSASSYAYACLNIVLGHRFGNYEAGFQFSKLGVDLVEREGLDRFRARVYMCFGCLTLPWVKHVSYGETWIQRGLETANDLGDLTFAAYSAKNLVMNLFFAGSRLDELEKKVESGLVFSRKAHFGLVVDCFVGQLTLIRALRGITPKFPTNEETNEIEFEQHLARNSHLSFAVCSYWIYKLQEFYFFGEYELAIDAAKKAQNFLWATRSFLEAAEYYFYAALAWAAFSDLAPEGRSAESLKQVREYYEQVSTWAGNCNENFATREALLAAELARLEDRNLDAELLYERSIQLAQGQGFIQNEALANELAAQFYRARELDTIAHAYLRNACNAYMRWGADAKVQQLDRLYSHVHYEPAEYRSSTLIETPIAHLDLTTVVKVSRAVSSEIVLDKLIQNLMTIAVEHAGAERALLILPEGDLHQIEAEARIEQEKILVHFIRKRSTSSELPESILKYVIRTSQTVILNNASAFNLFSSDEYLTNRQVRSILCVPLVKQAVLIGVLYLENTETSHVFTEARVEILELLASQAAISLEIARLHANLRESEVRLRFAIDTIPSIVWSSLPGGVVDFINRRWWEYTGLTPQMGYGSDWTDPVHSEDLEGMLAAWQSASETGSPFEYEARLRSADGEYRYFLNRALPLRDDSGKIVKWYGSNIDIEDRKRAERDLHIAFDEIASLKDSLYRENVTLKEEIERSTSFEEIIGTSPALNRVLTRIAKVAPTDSTVLITGETGTGKELVARAIHKASRRSERTFVSVNCAAIPQSLLASELFGHEKGAFTGAQQRRLGRFELADGGTIFLDEVGELPFETQVALLRVLQEREFERVGGSKPIHADVRVIAATNRNLHAAISEGIFREDLFYRLNVFPIEIPPLRERKEDIPMIVEHFVNRFARKTGKKIRQIKKKTLDLLKAYPWPGNIRELQNLIERSMIICETTEFTIDENWLDLNPGSATQLSRPSNQESSSRLREKDVIEAALAETRGRVSGPGGAASILKMPVSTLDYKIRTLKIDKYRFKRS